MPDLEPAADPRLGSAEDRDWFGTRADLPFAELERATSVLRGQLRAIWGAADTGGSDGVLDWETLTIEGPEKQVDHAGRSWFTYTASVATRPIRPRQPPISPCTDTPGATAS